jgi:hypothetical protein
VTGTTEGSGQEAASGPTHDPYAPRGKTSARGLSDVAALVAEADGEASKAEFMALADPQPGAAKDGIKPGEWQPEHDGLPPECPILALGTEDGYYFFLDTIGQLRILKDSEFGQKALTSLFQGRHHYLYWAWPRKNADGQVKGWRAEKVTEDLMAACARKGSWNASDRVRGRGLWTDKEGQLIAHCGDALITRHGRIDLGELEGNIYPTRPAIPKPWPVSLSGRPGPAMALLPHLKSWNWRRPELDPVLLIGWIAAGYLGAALKWRPSIVVTGDKATGKSSLQNDIKHIFDGALLRSGDATAAGIYQQLKFDCVGVALDEFEAKADNRRQKAVLELMRLSASGDDMHRGGDNHKGTSFSGRSAFLFSMINVPSLEPQDLSRMGILRLSKLKSGQSKPDIPPDELARLGRQVLRRIFDNWHRWPATYAAWREFLASCGHDGRGQDTFGVLMACADMVIDEDAAALGVELGPAAENFEDWRQHLTATGLAEYEDATANWQLCLGHLLSQRIDAWRGGTRHTIGEVLQDFWDEAGLESESDDPMTATKARKLLEQTGLTLMKPGGKDGAWGLFIPNQHPLLHQIYKDTKWQGELAAGTWSGALRDAPPDMWELSSARIHSHKKKGTRFHINALMKQDEEE